MNRRLIKIIGLYSYFIGITFIGIHLKAENLHYRNSSLIWDPFIENHPYAEGESFELFECKTNATGDLVIPSAHEGKPIDSIGQIAFLDCKNLSTIR